MTHINPCWRERRRNWRIQSSLIWPSLWWNCQKRPTRPSSRDHFYPSVQVIIDGNRKTDKKEDKVLFLSRPSLSILALSKEKTAPYTNIQFEQKKIQQKKIMSLGARCQNRSNQQNEISLLDNDDGFMAPIEFNSDSEIQNQREKNRRRFSEK